MSSLVLVLLALGWAPSSGQERDQETPASQPNEERPDDVSPDRASPDAADAIAAASVPAPKPPDGILPVGEIARLAYTPRDQPKALLYGTHLLVVGSTGFVDGYDAVTGEFVWKLGLPGETLFEPVVFEAGPLVEGVADTFTVVLSSPSGHVLIVDGLSGEIRREVQLSFELALPPTRGPDDIVFFATPSGDIVCYDVGRQEVVFQTATGERPLALASTGKILVVSGGDQYLTALDLASGAILWSHRGRAAFHAPVAFDDEGERVYAGDDTGEIYSLDAKSGAVRFRWSTGASARSQPLVEGDRLYLATYANTLFAFNAMSGDEHWRANLPGRPATPPMRVRNRLIVGTYDGVLIEIGPSRGNAGKQYVAPGELVFPPSFYLAQPDPKTLDEAATNGEDDVPPLLEEEDPLTQLDPDVFGPEEITLPSETDVGTDDEDADGAIDAAAALAREPAWFERSRIAMALRSGEVLLLGHQVAPTADPDSDPDAGEGTDDVPEDGPTGPAERDSRDSRTPPSDPRR